MPINKRIYYPHSLFYSKLFLSIETEQRSQINISPLRLLIVAGKAHHYSRFMSVIVQFETDLVAFFSSQQFLKVKSEFLQEYSFFCVNRVSLMRSLSGECVNNQ